MQRNVIDHGGYVEAIGRRKRAVARVRISKTGLKEPQVNDRPLQDYFPMKELQNTALAPCAEAHQELRVSVHVYGGGLMAQAEAVRHGLARALVAYLPDERATMKKLGFLTRDAREKERKKFGLRKARRAPQWSKR